MRLFLAGATPPWQAEALQEPGPTNFASREACAEADAWRAITNTRARDERHSVREIVIAKSRRRVASSFARINRIDSGGCSLIFSAGHGPSPSGEYQRQPV